MFSINKTDWYFIKPSLHVVLTCTIICLISLLTSSQQTPPQNRNIINPIQLDQIRSVDITSIPLVRNARTLNTFQVLTDSTVHHQSVGNRSTEPTSQSLLQSSPYRHVQTQQLPPTSSNSLSNALSSGSILGGLANGTGIFGGLPGLPGSSGSGSLPGSSSGSSPGSSSSSGGLSSLFPFLPSGGTNSGNSTGPSDPLAGIFDNLISGNDPLGILPSGSSNATKPTTGTVIDGSGFDSTPTTNINPVDNLIDTSKDNPQDPTPPPDSTPPSTPDDGVPTPPSTPDDGAPTDGTTPTDPAIPPDDVVIPPDASLPPTPIPDPTIPPTDNDPTPPPTAPGDSNDGGLDNNNPVDPGSHGDGGVVSVPPSNRNQAAVVVHHGAALLLVLSCFLFF